MTSEYGTYQLQLKHDTRGIYAEATQVAHACFCQKHAMTHAINYLHVQGYTHLHHLFTRKVQFYMHTRVLAVMATRN